MTTTIDLGGLAYSGMPIEATIRDSGQVEVSCNGYLYSVTREPPTDLAEAVREAFAEFGMAMDAEDEADLAVWDEVERRIAEAWEAKEAEAA